MEVEQMRKILLGPIWSLILLGLMAWLFVVNPSFIESLRLRYFDQLIINQESVPNNLYAVNIDEAAIEAYGQWPFPRANYSDIIIDLYNRGAGLVVFNVLMSEKDRSGTDQDLEMTMQQVPVILTMLGTEENKNDPINPGASIINSDYMSLIPSVPGITANIYELESNAVGSGIINTFPELDGVTRRAPLVFESGGTLYPNITMEVLRVLAGDPSFQIKLSPLGVDKLRIPQFGIIPTNEAGEVWLDWSQEYKSVSLMDLPDDFGGAVVFVGPTAAGVTQPIATAKGSIFPHEIQAVMLGTVFNESNITRHPDAKAWGELAALAGAGLLLIVLAKWTYIGLGFFVLSIGGFIGASIYVFNTQNILIDGATISAFLLLVGLVRYVLKFVDEFLQKQAIKKQFEGYASPTVVRLLQESPELIKLGTKRNVSIVFSDLRGFTPLGESFGDDVQGLTRIMNGYMDAITEPVLDANGMIIKYIGDASMHIHNAPIDDDRHEHTAIETSLKMLKAVEKFNEEVIIPDGRPPVGMGAGVNTGLGYLGEMGSTKRHSYDVLGDAVSTAARVESKCKEYGCLLLVGEATYEKTKDDFFYLKVDDLQVKGKSVGLSIYTVLDNPENKWKAGQKHHEGMHGLYRMKLFDEAIAQCKLIQNEFDGQMKGYYDMWIERCEYMKTQNLPEKWNGVFIATSK
jgi:adenylate cyclase